MGENLWPVMGLLSTVALALLIATWGPIVDAHRHGTKTARHPAQHAGVPWWQDPAPHHLGVLAVIAAAATTSTLLVGALIVRAVTA